MVKLLVVIHIFEEASAGTNIRKLIDKSTIFRITTHGKGTICLHGQYLPLTYR